MTFSSCSATSVAEIPPVTLPINGTTLYCQLTDAPCDYNWRNNATGTTVRYFMLAVRCGLDEAQEPGVSRSLRRRCTRRGETPRSGFETPLMLAPLDLSEYGSPTRRVRTIPQTKYRPSWRQHGRQVPADVGVLPTRLVLLRLSRAIAMILCRDHDLCARGAEK